MAQLLRPQSKLCRSGRTGWVAEATGTAVLRETVDAAAHAPTPPAGLGDIAGRGHARLAQPQGILAHGGQQHRPTCPEQAVVGETRGAQHAATVDCTSLRRFSVVTAGTARCGPACRVVWEGGAHHSPRPDSARHPAPSLEAATAHRLTAPPVWGCRPLQRPVVQPQPWHLLEVPPIPGDQHYAMDQRCSCNAEITTAHAQPHRT
jgi:hypothetical protein